MELLSSYTYGGGRRKRKHGVAQDHAENSLRSVLEAHVRKSLGLTSLKTQDKKLMGWTIGDLALFGYTSAVEKMAELTVVQAIRKTNFDEAARFIAAERGILAETSEDALRRVSANMAKRFWESRLAEALESFISLHGPEGRAAGGRGPKSEPEELQACNPPPPPRRGPAPKAAAAAAAPSYSRYHTANAQIHTLHQQRQPTAALNTVGKTGPCQAQSAQPEARAAPPAPIAGWRPFVYGSGTEPCASERAPSCRPPDRPGLKHETGGPQDGGPLGPVTNGSGAACGRPQPAAAGAAVVPGGEVPGASRGTGRMPPELEGSSRFESAAADEDGGLPCMQHSAAVRCDRQALRRQLLRPPPLGRPHNGHHDVHHSPLGQVTGCNIRNGNLLPAQLLQSQRQQQQRCMLRSLPPGSPPGCEGRGLFHDRSGSQPQSCIDRPTTPSSRDSGAAAAAAADDLAREHEVPLGALGQQQLLAQSQEQEPAGRVGAQGERWQAPQRKRLEQHVGQQRDPPQQQLEPHERRIRKKWEPPQQQQQQREQQERNVTGSRLSERVPLARRPAANGQPGTVAPARSGGSAAAAGAGGGVAAGPNSSNGGDHQAVQGGGPKGVAAPSAVLVPTAAAAGGTLSEALRREYTKRRAAASLEKRLRKHLHTKRNSMIRQYCVKEGLPWTLLEVVCYGVALQKLSSQPFTVEAAVRFLAMVKGWRPGGGGEAAAVRSHGTYEQPPSSLVERVAAVMSTAVAKYEIEAFIERQRRTKKLPQQQQEAGLRQAAIGTAATAAAMAGAAAGVGHVLGTEQVAQDNGAPNNAHTSPNDTIGVTAPLLAATTSSQQPQHSDGGSAGSGGVSSADDVDRGGPAAAAVAAADQLQQLPDACRMKRTGRIVKRNASALNRRRGSAPTAGRNGAAAAAAGLESRLRAHLTRQGVRKLRRRNVSEGVGWTLLDLAEKDRDARLQHGCDALMPDVVVERLLEAKLGPDWQRSPADVEAVSASVISAHKMYQIGAFVSAEVKKRLKRRQRQTHVTLAAAGGVAAAAASVGGHGGRSEDDVIDLT